VIAQAYLNEWSSRAPWPQQVQIEQDLVLSRLIVEIAQHELLGGELTFRGGTCLHKLHLRKQLRYSEDLDYVRRTFQIEELMATKLRALYQRRKGRDLFDLWHVLTDLHTDEQLIVDGLEHYMGDETFSYSELSANLAAKLDHPDFITDLDQLTADSPTRYNVTLAADLTMERLGSRLVGAPGLGEIESGRWRSTGS
jgi:predicted nucleotidyltransferase component of viral defense system